MTVEWVLPTGASSLIGYAQMDDRSFAWGDCVVVVSVVSPIPGGPEREIARGRLNAETPSLTIATGLGGLGSPKPGDRLRVRVDPGERGPIPGPVVLRRMVVLTGTAAN